MPELRMIDGCRDVRKRAALAFVHPLRRLDVSAHAILSIEVLVVTTFVVDRKIVTFPGPHVALELDRRTCAALYAMTATILAAVRDDTPVAILVGGECVSRPILREPLGSRSSFSISADTIEDAHVLARRLRSKGVRPPLTAVMGGSAGAGRLGCEN